MSARNAVVLVVASLVMAYVLGAAFVSVLAGWWGGMPV